MTRASARCATTATTTRRFVSVAMRVIVLAIPIAIFFLSGCGHPKAKVDVPPPPPPESTTETAESSPAAKAPSSREISTKTGNEEPGEEKAGAETGAGADLAEPAIPANTKPLASETGLASWYGPPYHNRRGSNGEVYNMHAMTAAHRTYPLGSIVRVTNAKTGHTALVRITDRGPFIPGRVLDLSLAAARKVDVWQPGVAEVRVELMLSGAAVGASGKWAVQIGGFPHEPAARKLSAHLQRRYRTAKVLCFNSPAGDWWVRIRVLEDDHDGAQKLAAETKTSEGAVFLVRLD